MPTMLYKHLGRGKEREGWERWGEGLGAGGGRDGWGEDWNDSRWSAAAINKYQAEKYSLGWPHIDLIISEINTQSFNHIEE